MFKQRSYQKELLDNPIIPKNLLFRNLLELEYINRKLGGHAVSLKGLKKIMADRSKAWNIIDIGCGGGDSLKAIAAWSDKNEYSIKLTGIDLKQDCIDYARNNCSAWDNINFQCNDFKNSFSKDKAVDIVHASLFCHHFTEEDIIAFARLCNRNGAVFMINDLERNPLAYYSIKWLTALFSKSPLVKNDAPLSVLRGFKRREWKTLLQKAGLKKYTIKNCWAFRHLVIIYPDA